MYIVHAETHTMQIYSFTIAIMQQKFTVEVYEPYQSLCATCDSLRSSTAMLTDQTAAQEAFAKFDNISTRVTR